MRIFTVVLVAVGLWGFAKGQDGELAATTAPRIAMEDWLKADLDPREYDFALRYGGSLSEWKDMDESRSTRKAAGWACIAIGLLIPAIEATVIYGGGFPIDEHPNTEIYATTTVAALAVFMSGIFTLASAPGPEDFRQRWAEQFEPTTIEFRPTLNGAQLAYRF